MSALSASTGVVRQYRMVPWLHAMVALSEVGDAPRAQALCAEACAWIHSTARLHVHEPFRDSFPNRNSVNRELLALGLFVV